MAAEHHIQGWGLIGCIRCVSQLWGRGAFSKLLPEFSEFSQEHLRHQVQSSAYYPLSVATELVAQVERAFGDGRGSAAEQFGDAVGRLAMETVFVVYKGTADFGRAFNSLPRAWQKIYPDTDARAEVVSSDQRSQGVIRYNRFIEGREVWIPFWVGWFRGYMESALGPGKPVQGRAIENPPSVEFQLSLR